MDNSTQLAYCGYYNQLNVLHRFCPHTGICYYCHDSSGLATFWLARCRDCNRASKEKKKTKNAAKREEGTSGTYVST
ncbi:hypothetical protein Bca101_014869 [Brassica carinata]